MRALTPDVLIPAVTATTNVLRDPWIPCETQEGIEFRSVTGAFSADVRGLAFERADLNRAVEIFLIAVVQSAVLATPSWIPDREAWLELLRQRGVDHVPMPFEAAFGFREFLQGGIPASSSAKIQPLAALMPDTPGDSTAENHRDVVFWEENMPSTIPGHELIALLIQYQMVPSPVGGGFSEGVLSGSSVLTTMLPESPKPTLWETVLLNVIPLDSWDATVGETTWDESVAFPWIKGFSAAVVTPDTTHPLLAYWGCPKAVELEFSELGLPIGYRKAKLKRSFSGFRHPLASYFTKKEGDLGVEKHKGPRVGYEHWLTLCLKSPPWVARDLYELDEFDEIVGSARSFGWLASKAEMLVFVDSTLPVIKSTPSTKSSIENLVLDAEKMARSLARKVIELERGVKDSGEKEGKEKKEKDKERDKPIRIPSLTDHTEEQFYEFVNRVAAGESCREEWQAVLRKARRDLFEEVVRRGRYDLCRLAQIRVSL